MVGLVMCGGGAGGLLATATLHLPLVAVVLSLLTIVHRSARACSGRGGRGMDRDRQGTLVSYGDVATLWGLMRTDREFLARSGRPPERTGSSLTTTGAGTLSRPTPPRRSPRIRSAASLAPAIWLAGLRDPSRRLVRAS